MPSLSPSQRGETEQSPRGARSELACPRQLGGEAVFPSQNEARQRQAAKLMDEERGKGKSCPDASWCNSVAWRGAGTGGPNSGHPSPAPLQRLSAGRRQPGKHQRRCQIIVCCHLLPQGPWWGCWCHARPVPAAAWWRFWLRVATETAGGLQKPRAAPTALCSSASRLKDHVHVQLGSRFALLGVLHNC